MIATQENIFTLLSTIPDPEIPVITIAELGVLRSVEIINDEVNVTITPTYNGCPAMKAIENEIRSKLSAKGFEKVNIKLVYAPAWTTDWFSEETKEKLRKYGIAPPTSSNPLLVKKNVSCPRCGSADIKLVSQFGSTACKAFYTCNSCREPFDYFKCH